MKNKTIQALIFVILITLLCAGVYVYVTYYVNSLTTKTSDLQQQIADDQVTYQHAETLHNAASNLGGQKQQIADYFIPANGAVDFISSLEERASDFGLDYTTQSISQKDMPELAEQNKELLQVAVSVSGNWSAVMRFLKMIETMPYGMTIDKTDLSLTAGDASSTSRQWMGNVSFSILKTKDNAK